MRRSSILLAGAWIALTGCDGQSGPAAPAGPPALDFQVQIPREIESKSTVELLVTVTTARDVRYPLEVRVEKANMGQPFLLEGIRLLAEGERTAVFVAVPRQDPQYRVTLTESGAGALSVQKTVSVEVLDFP